MKNIPIEILRQREYLTPGQAALLFGHGKDYWREAFDQHRVAGYVEGKGQYRYLSVESIRNYLNQKCQQRSSEETEYERLVRLKKESLKRILG